MSSYRIVAAARDQLREIPRIEQAAATVYSEEDLPGDIRYRVTDRDLLEAAQEDGRLWVAVDRRGQPVGFALAEVLGDEACLDEVDVHPLHMRRGLGTRLVETVVDWAEREGFRSLSLLTFRHLPWNAAFYARLGFEPIDEEQLVPGLRQLLEEEGRAGINVANRVGMRRRLGSPRRGRRR